MAGSKIKDLVKCGQILHDLGLIIGPGGNISIRDGKHIIIKKQGADMAIDGAKAYTRLLFSQAEKGKEILSTETPFHLACYKADKTIAAVIHAHSPYTIAAAERTDVLRDISYEFECILKGPVPVVEYIKPGSQDLAEAIAKEIKKGACAVILKKHGAVAVGTNIEEALLRIQALERACITFLHSA